ncbi:TPA_asm: hypothetical protein G4A83_004878, partial [Salmonella enterica subsp. enterica serovar Typhimurium]|nr:hypothetical protein [Salmonella enterica subsp. enterica]EDT0082963.1 hypothetical protein [Salmonella enterica subsp. enterica serovar Typhimurium]EDY3071100.1 hypothetical protein [Salmonella enterica]EDY7053383.1 hypothetical protein [Salmonella enterica subsp. enterica serovar Heidelberg]EDZ2919410.1 hypothetical protein [Salmonella enterica subsp. enterica serovar Anatum]
IFIYILNVLIGSYCTVFYASLFGAVTGSMVLDMEIKYDSEIKRNGSASGDY